MSVARICRFSFLQTFILVRRASPQLFHSPFFVSSLSRSVNFCFIFSSEVSPIQERTSRHSLATEIEGAFEAYDCSLEVVCARQEAYRPARPKESRILYIDTEGKQNFNRYPVPRSRMLF